MDARESCLSHSAVTSRSVEIPHLRRVPMQKLDRTCCIGITTSPQFRDKATPQSADKIRKPSHGDVMLAVTSIYPMSRRGAKS